MGMIFDRKSANLPHQSVIKSDLIAAHYAICLYPRALRQAYALNLPFLSIPC